MILIARAQLTDSRRTSHTKARYATIRELLDDQELVCWQAARDYDRGRPDGFLRQSGRVVSITIKRDSITGERSCYGYVEVDSPQLSIVPATEVAG